MHIALKSHFIQMGVDNRFIANGCRDMLSKHLVAVMFTDGRTRTHVHTRGRRDNMKNTTVSHSISYAEDIKIFPVLVLHQILFYTHSLLSVFIRFSDWFRFVFCLRSRLLIHVIVYYEDLVEPIINTEVMLATFAGVDSEEVWGFSRTLF